MLKKYGFIMLLLLGLCGVRSALASCAFTTPTGTYIDQTMASSPVTAVTLTSTNLQQLFQSSVRWLADRSFPPVIRPREPPSPYRGMVFLRVHCLKRCLMVVC